MRNFCLIMLLLLIAEPALTVSSIFFSAPDKPPYYQQEGGQVSGFLTSIVQCIFKDAPFQARYVIIPIKRIHYLLHNEDHCSLGWFKTKERETYMKFSKPIWKDKKLLVLVRSTQKEAYIKNFKSFTALLKDPTKKILLPAAVSFGNKTDQILDMFTTKESRIPGTFRQTIWMIALGRADYTLVHGPEFNYFKKVIASEFKDGISAIEFKDLKGRLERYIVCSKKTPQSRMQEINRLISKSLAPCLSQHSFPF